MKIQKDTALYAILLGGLIGGSIDIGSAAVINGYSPVVIMHAIASGLLGADSFKGGLPTAIVGVLLQWAMALIIAAIYVGVMSRLPELRRRWVFSGTVSGVIIFFVMNYVVVPFSAAPFKPKFSLEGFESAFKPDKFVENLIAMILFGLIIGFFAKDIGKAKA